jgi:5-oxopent-3-ene-1,2,5-tricarboxylate decarboxylase/2-hydroxyhepta-2,4-diene-1,7-dioate isomerase
MKLVRFAYNGAVHEGVYEDQQIKVGSVSYDPDAVMYLSPVEHVGKAIGIALGYKDHAAELKLEIPDYPLLFHKMPNTFIGHKAKVILPPNLDYVHYECELVAIIGRSCKKVKAKDALNYVKGYTIGNEITVRDFVTNYFRPPVKAKGFDTFGPVGPYLVTADEIDPTNVTLRTYVNGELRQHGNTGNLRHSIAELIEYMSDFMTLQEGDMIWSGTPEGISHIYPGDHVACEIEGIGKLENQIVSELSANEIKTANELIKNKPVGLWPV